MRRVLVLGALVVILVGVGVVSRGEPISRQGQPLPSAPTPPSEPFFDESPPLTTTTTTTQPPVTSVAARPPVDPGNGECANPVIPERIARAESGCRWDAYNPTGCGGRGCLGFYQLDQGHFAEVSPWNSSRSGGCVDLAAVRWEPWAQTECASRLGPSAWGQ